jgi:hypothetical protein
LVVVVVDKKCQKWLDKRLKVRWLMSQVVALRS